MSISKTQGAATRAELQSNLALSGLTVSGLATDDIATNLGLSAARVRAALGVAEARREDLRRVRRYLDRVIRSADSISRTYFSLTEHKRAAAQTWFSLDNALKKVSR